MQEEIEEKSVRLAITTTKLSVRTIVAGVKAYLRHRQKKQLAAIDEHIQGNNHSYYMNYQKSGKDLMTVDEIAVMDGDKCILQLRGVRPFLSDKYDVTQHPLYKETGEYDERNKLDIQRFLHQGIKVESGEMYDVVRV